MLCIRTCSFNRIAVPYDPFIQKYALVTTLSSWVIDWQSQSSAFVANSLLMPDLCALCALLELNRQCDGRRCRCTLKTSHTITAPHYFSYLLGITWEIFSEAELRKKIKGEMIPLASQQQISQWRRRGSKVKLVESNRERWLSWQWDWSNLDIRIPEVVAPCDGLFPITLLPEFQFYMIG